MNLQIMIISRTALSTVRPVPPTSPPEETYHLRHPTTRSTFRPSHSTSRRPINSRISSHPIASPSYRPSPLDDTLPIPNVCPLIDKELAFLEGGRLVLKPATPKLAPLVPAPLEGGLEGGGVYIG
ncbi:hypothetical protein M422DRAFT_272187 [Sphaerobolus stellatus SS14]|uniref:Uncharacterized protein n=1 Tax=Sphaerobolus stellatus (strain SS14) TaxID=990650 RepID=A0A0C9UML0_SPHS4|nr:hypothetical protein M422DRAFT_272187 [Sphaerobolus stellatus SS14]